LKPSKKKRRKLKDATAEVAAEGSKEMKAPLFKSQRAGSAKAGKERAKEAAAKNQRSILSMFGVR
jgi:hypothetical protein